MTPSPDVGRVLPVRANFVTYGHVYRDGHTWTGEKLNEFGTVRAEFPNRATAEGWVLTNVAPIVPAGVVVA